MNDYRIINSSNVKFRHTPATHKPFFINGFSICMIVPLSSYLYLFFHFLRYLIIVETKQGYCEKLFLVHFVKSLPLIWVTGSAMEKYVYNFRHVCNLCT